MCVCVCILMYMCFHFHMTAQVWNLTKEDCGRFFYCPTCKGRMSSTHLLCEHLCVVIPSQPTHIKPLAISATPPPHRRRLVVLLSTCIPGTGCVPLILLKHHLKIYEHKGQLTKNKVHLVFYPFHCRRKLSSSPFLFLLLLHPFIHAFILKQWGVEKDSTRQRKRGEAEVNKALGKGRMDYFAQVVTSLDSILCSRKLRNSHQYPVSVH